VKVAALGAGRMGRGIGHVFAYAGLEVDVIDFKNHVEVVAQARLDAREELLHVREWNVARANVDGRARIVERTGHVLAIHAGRDGEVVARFLVHTFRSNRREEDLGAHPGDPDSSLEEKHLSAPPP
jgi:3-hydroxyacyl-CoA dehydrogenase